MAQNKYLYNKNRRSDIGEDLICQKAPPSDPIDEKTNLADNEVIIKPAKPIFRKEIKLVINCSEKAACSMGNNLKLYKYITTNAAIINN